MSAKEPRTTTIGTVANTTANIESSVCFNIRFPVKEKYRSLANDTGSARESPDRTEDAQLQIGGYPFLG
jgi:hypothetical protein